MIITSKGPFEHKGITLSFEGAVHMTAKFVPPFLHLCSLSVSAHTINIALCRLDIGLFDSLGQAMKPIPLINTTIQLAKPATLPDGVSEIPFEFPVEPLPSTL